MGQPRRKDQCSRSLHYSIALDFIGYSSSDRNLYIVLSGTLLPAQGLLTNFLTATGCQ